MADAPGESKPNKKAVKHLTCRQPDRDEPGLVCGYRRTNKPLEKFPGSSTTIFEILVSCSARFPEGRWVEVHEFLSKWGGYNTLLARPRAD